MRGRRVVERFEFEWRDHLDPLPPVRHRVIEGFEDASDVLGPGVYVLEREGEVMYVGWAPRVLERIADHRRLLTSTVAALIPLPAIVYDRFHFRRCAEDVGDRLVADLIAQYSPPYNQRTSSHASLAAP